jgi:RNA polymerase sigma-70 factor, ECF subfamily
MMPAVIDAPSAQRRPPPPELARELLARCKAGDPLAFRAFVVRYERPVFALLSRIVGHGPHVEDLAQDVFLRAFRAFPRFDLDAAARPSTWILTIATRVALDARRRVALPTIALDGDHLLLAAASNPELEHRRAELGSRARR